MEAVPCSEPTDEQALIAAAQRSPAAFAPLYEMHVQKIYQYVRHRTGSPVEAEEIAAQTFMRALEYLPRYRWQGAPFVAWLYRIANSLIAGERRRPRQQTLPDNLAAGATDGGLEAVEQRHELLRGLSSLPEVQQQVLILRFAQRLSYEEIAAVIGRSQGATRQLAHRGLLTLRERMERP